MEWTVEQKSLAKNQVMEDSLALKAMIVQERFKQIDKWGDEAWTPDVALRVLVEEVGEVAMAMNDHKPEDYRAEMIQVMTVAARAITSFDRRKKMAAEQEKFDEEYYATLKDQETRDAQQLFGSQDLEA